MRPPARSVVCSLVLVLAAWSPSPADRDVPCALAASIGTDAACSLSQQCPGEPARTIACEDDTCTCWAGDEPAGVCAGNGVCAESGSVTALGLLAETCCGFDFDRG